MQLRTAVYLALIGLGQPRLYKRGERLSRRASIGQQVTARQRLECAQHFQQRRLFRRPESPRLRDRCGILRRYRKPDHFNGLVVHAAFPVVREPEPRRQHRLHGVIHGAEESVTDEERELYQFLVQYRCGVEHGIYAFEVLPLALIRDREDDPLAAPIALAERQAHPRPRKRSVPQRFWHEIVKGTVNAVCSGRNRDFCHAHRH